MLWRVTWRWGGQRAGGAGRDGRSDSAEHVYQHSRTRRGAVPVLASTVVGKNSLRHDEQAAFDQSPGYGDAQPRRSLGRLSSWGEELCQREGTEIALRVKRRA